MGFIRAILYYIVVFTGMIILGTPYIIYKSITKRKYEITDDGHVLHVRRL